MLQARRHTRSFSHICHSSVALSLKKKNTPTLPYPVSPDDRLGLTSLLWSSCKRYRSPAVKITLAAFLLEAQWCGANWVKNSLSCLTVQALISCVKPLEEPFLHLPCSGENLSMTAGDGCLHAQHCSHVHAPIPALLGNPVELGSVALTHCQLLLHRVLYRFGNLPPPAPPQNKINQVGFCRERFPFSNSQVISQLSLLSTSHGRWGGRG